MNKFLCILAPALLLAELTVYGETNQLKSLPLRECVERALVNNIEIRAERINPSIQTWGVIGAQGVYDPVLTGALKYQDSTTPQDSLPAATQQTLQPSLGLTGKLPTGATYDFSANDTRTSGNVVTNFLYTGQAGVSVTQPLWKNFGLGINAATIRIARKSKTIAVQNFIQLVMTKVSAVSTAYYELVFALEDHKAKVEDLNQAKQLLAEDQRRVQVGVLTPLDVTQAEAGVAERQQAVILAARTIKDNENTLKRLICREVSEFRGTSLLPVDYPLVQMIQTDTAESTRTALVRRPDYLSAKEALEKQNIVVQFNRNQLWPEIDLQGSYGLNGRGRSFSSYTANQTTDDSPVWSVGIAVSIPIGNRQARSNYHVARLDADQLLLNLKALEQDIIVQVDNAVGHVEANLESVKATHEATRLAQESLDAEKKKLLAGTSTTFLVLQAQAQLATARSAEIRARSDYSESLVALDQAEGTILSKNNITLKLDD